MKVKKSDFEVFEALALDSVNVTNKNKQSKYGGDAHCCTVACIVMYHTFCCNL